MNWPLVIVTGVVAVLIAAPALWVLLLSSLRERRRAARTTKEPPPAPVLPAVSLDTGAETLRRVRTIIIEGSSGPIDEAERIADAVQRALTRS